jgi:hypothetical protein
LPTRPPPRRNTTDTSPFATRFTTLRA